MASWGEKRVPGLGLGLGTLKLRIEFLQSSFIPSILLALSLIIFSLGGVVGLMRGLCERGVLTCNSDCGFYYVFFQSGYSGCFPMAFVESILLSCYWTSLIAYHNFSAVGRGATVLPWAPSLLTGVLNCIPYRLKWLSG